MMMGDWLVWLEKQAGGRHDDAYDAGPAAAAASAIDSTDQLAPYTPSSIADIGNIMDVVINNIIIVRRIWK